jgi:hypothetical protein
MRFSLCLLVTATSFALEPLPQGHGIATGHPGDSGIENHPAL